MDLAKEEEILNALLNFEVPVIPSETRFWMIRTQGGYFYDEFIAKKFVALAWNNIDCRTDFTESKREYLKDDIVMEFPEIGRPSTVVNKCNNFINEVHNGDILVIPNKGSKYVTFATADEYFEDDSKTVSIEKVVIERIKHKDVDINDVSCPYKKRRHIKLLRTIKSEDINYSLYRAISNYHGISNLDNYAHPILNSLYNCYTFMNDAVLVYNVRKQTPIKPRELSGLIYGNTECLCMIIQEENISTQMALNSPGDAVYLLEKAYELARDNWVVVFGLLVFIGGGSALTFRVPGVIEVIKKVLLLPADVKTKKLENQEKEIDIQLKRLELHEKIKSTGANPEDLINPLEALSKSSSSLIAEPIILNAKTPVVSIAECENVSPIDTDEEHPQLQ